MKEAQATRAQIRTWALDLRRLFVQDQVLVGMLGLLVLVSRLPFQSKILYHWDSVNFVYAMYEFNVAKDQPQPPGYILYVGLCRLVNVLLRDPQTTMVSISITASVLAAVALFCLGRSMFDRHVGLIAGLFLATSPLFWFYGEIALPHTLDTLLVIASVWWLYETMQGNYRYLYPAVATVAIAGGVRQQTLVFLIPMLLFALRRVGWRRFLIAGLVGAAICLAWFIPLMILSGGYSNYLHVVRDYARLFQSTTSVFMGAGWSGIERNVTKLMLYTLYGWNIMLLPAVVYPLDRLRRRAWPQGWSNLVFLLLWVMPALAFYTLVHMGQQGLIFVFLPMLLLFSALCLRRWMTAQPRGLVAAVTIVVALNVGIFGLVSEYPWGSNAQRVLTRATLVNSDRYYQDRFRVIEENFDPASTAILASNWHHVEYYLPTYTRLRYSIDGTRDNFVSTPAELGLRLDANGKAVVIIFDPILERFNAKPELVQALPLPDGDQLEYMALGPDEHLYLDTNSFGLIPR